MSPGIDTDLQLNLGHSPEIGAGGQVVSVSVLQHIIIHFNILSRVQEENVTIVITND